MLFYRLLIYTIYSGTYHLMFWLGTFFFLCQALCLNMLFICEKCNQVIFVYTPAGDWVV